MYIDYFLKFADQSEADAMLYEGEERQSKYVAIDVIGTIYKPVGDTLEMAPLDGWHVNVRHNAVASELTAYQIYPQHPIREWA